MYHYSRSMAQSLGDSTTGKLSPNSDNQMKYFATKIVCVYVKILPGKSNQE